MRITGHVIGGPADYDYDGAVLTQDLELGDTVLHVDETGDFDEDAAKRDAQLAIDLDFDTDGELVDASVAPLAYDTCDSDAGTVTLAAASTVEASAGDLVYLLDRVTGYPVGSVEVLVAIDDSDTTGDPLRAYVDAALLASVGSVDLNDLAVELEEDEDDQLFVASFPGLTRRMGDAKFYEDETIALGAASETLLLTYRPKPHSEHLYWAGKYERGAEWSRDQWTVTIPNETLLIKAGDNLVMEYAYEDPGTRPIVPAALELVGFASFGTENTPFTSIPIPAGVEAGDLLVVGCMCYAPDQPVVSTDARVITQNSQVNTSGVGGVFPNGAYYTALAIADATLDDLDIGQAGIADCVVICAAFRYVGVLSATWTGIRDAVADGNVYDLAAPDGATKSIAVLIGQRGVVSVGFSVDSTLTYATVDGQSDAHLGLAQALIAWSDTGGAGEWGGLSSPSAWAAMMIGVSDG